jgi:putative hydrolase of the HAD superfamily
VGLLTDGPAQAQYGKLETLGWRDAFDAVVVTGELPAGKPDPRAFAAILEALEVAPEQAVFVGDHPIADVQGAAQAGLYSIQVLREDGEQTRSSHADATVSGARLAEELRELLLAQSRLPE